MNHLMKPEEGAQESLIQDFSLPVLGILTASAIGDPTGISAASHPNNRQRSVPPSHQPSDYQKVNLNGYINGENKRQKVLCKDQMTVKSFGRMGSLRKLLQIVLTLKKL